MNKREFVFGSCGALLVGGAAAGALPARAPQAAETRRPHRLPDLAAGHSLDAWRAYLGQRFQIGALRAGVVLAAVEDNPSSASLQQFTLVFRADAGAQPLAAGTHVLAHRRRQRLPLYLEAARRDAQGTSYQAHFSLLA